MSKAIVSKTHLLKGAIEAGLHFVSVRSIDDLVDELQRQHRHVAQWVEEGHHGEMDYMRRHLAVLSDPRLVAPFAKSVVSFLVPYFQGFDPRSLSDEFVQHLVGGTTPQGYGRVARYAWGRDYHKVLRKKIETFVSLVAQQLDVPIQARYATDSVPLLERAIGSELEHGFIGKNTMLIRPKVGSFCFLAEILWDVAWDANETSSPTPPPSKLRSLSHQPGTGCKSCTSCLTRCPTNAFPQPGTLDSRRCISYLTIEKRGLHTPEEQSWCGSWIFGCDVCQDVCPFNHRGIPISSHQEFFPQAGVGPFLKLEDVFNLSDHEKLIKLCAATPLMRTKREGLIRNALAVVVNTRDFQQIRHLGRLADEDQSDLIRQGARAAMNSLLDYADGSDRQFLQRYV